MITQKVFRGHFIAVCRTGLENRLKPIANLNTLNGVNTHQRPGEICIQLFKNRLSPTHWHSRRY